MATNKRSLYLQARHNLSSLLLTNWKWLYPILIPFNTLCLVEFYIQLCGALQWTHWRSYLKQLICSCLASWFSGKATTVDSPPNFPKLISQLWGIGEPEYNIVLLLLLDPHWTYFCKHYIYYKEDTKVGSQNFGFQIWFCTSQMREDVAYVISSLIGWEPKTMPSHRLNYALRLIQYKNQGWFWVCTQPMRDGITL